MEKLDWKQQFAEVDITDILDDVENIPLTADQLIEICHAFQCQVDLTKGNILYKVEKKYRKKLSRYNNSKRLKWIGVHLPKIYPNPEASYLRWKQRNQKYIKPNWLKRKLDALDYFEETYTVCSWSENSIEEPCCSNMVNKPLRRLSYLSHTSQTCSSGNESVQTVIRSQPKATQEISQPLQNSIHIEPLLAVFDDETLTSSSGLSSEHVTSSENIIPNETGNENTKKTNSSPKKLASPKTKRVISSLLRESEGFSCSEDIYQTFNQEMLVTSTQEFN